MTGTGSPRQCTTPCRRRWAGRVRSRPQAPRSPARALGYCSSSRSSGRQPRARSRSRNYGERSMKAVSFTRVGLVALIVGLVACGDDGPTDPSTPKAIGKVSADSQTTTVGVAMAQPLVVVVTNAAGTPLVDVEVVWGILAGGGSFNDTTTTT